MSVIPYLSQGQGVEVDPLTGLPKAKKKATAAAPTFGSYVPSNPGWGAAGTYAKNTAPISVGGSTPNYADLIRNALAPFQAQLGAEGVQDATSRDNQLVRALGQFGQQWDLGSATSAFGQDFANDANLGDLLPQINQLAQQTTDSGMSFTARAAKAHKDAVRQIKNALAARGALQSGELGHQLQEQQTGFDTGQYDARLQLQDYVGAVQQGYLQEKRARDAQLAAAQREEAGRQAGLHPAVADRPATWNGTGYVYGDGTPVPRELWPAGAGSATAGPSLGAAAPIGGPNVANPNDPRIQALMAQSLAANPQGGFGPSSAVDYGSIDEYLRKKLRAV